MTVARAVEQLLPDYPLLYLGDIARTPYGTKSARTIIDYSLENTRFLVQNGAKVIVIACNSASSVATERLRREFNIPIIEVITPAIEQALATSRTGRIGVIGTRATIRSGVYEDKIHRQSPDLQGVLQSLSFARSAGRRRLDKQEGNKDDPSPLSAQPQKPTD